MPEELRTKLSSVRRRLKTSLWQGGLCALFAGASLIFLLAGFLDWLVIGESPSGRFVLTLAATAAILWLLKRELWKPLSHPLNDLWLAQRIEDKIPELNGGLTSTVEFTSGEYDERFGSQSLQKQSVDHTIRKLLTVDLVHVVDPRPLRIRSYFATILALVLLLITMILPAHAWTAFQRLSRPWEKIEWPRDVVLNLETAEGEAVDASYFADRLFPRGATLELAVTNLRGDLPEDLQLMIRQDDETLRRESIPVVSSDQQLESFGQIQIPLRESFEFRISGGDDDQIPWMRVEVVPPPMLSQIRLMLEPPLYTQRDPEEIPAGTSFIQALIGSRLLVEGIANTTLSHAGFETSRGKLIPLELTEGTGEFEGAFTIEEVGNEFYKLQFLDELGIGNDSALRLEITGVADQIPAVTLISPETDQFLTPNAELKLTVRATDDVNLTQLTLSLTPVSDHASERQWLQDFLDAPQPRMETELSVKLSDLGFRAGDVLKLKAIGQDQLSQGEEHLGIDERLLTIVSEEEKHRELSDRLEELVDQIERTADRQSILKDLFTESDPGSENLQSLLSDQKRIERNLIEEQDSLQADLNDLIREADQNRLDRPRLRKRLGDLNEDFKLLSDQEFPRLNQFLGRLAAEPGKEVEESPQKRVPLNEQVLEDSEALNDWLNSQPDVPQSQLLKQIAEAQQQRIETKLKDMAGSLSEWKKQQSIQDSLGELIDQQKEIGEKTKQLNQRLQGKTTRQLNDDERNRLQQLSADQLRNQERLREFQDLLDQETNGENSRSQIDDLSESVKSSDATGQMSENQRALRENHLNEADERNRQLLKEFQEWDDQLNNRPVTDAELKMQLLEEQSRQLDQLLSEQKQLGENIESQTSPEAREAQQAQQDELNQQAGRLERMLDRLQLPESSEAVEAAEQEMQQLQQELKQGNNSQPSSESAEQKLAEAREAMDRERQSLESDHQRELLGDLLPRLIELAQLQQILHQEAAQLLQQYQEQERWSRPLLKTLSELRDGQQTAHQKLMALRASLGEIKAVKLAVERLINSMQKSHEEISARELNPAVLESMPKSLRQFQILIEVLQRLIANQEEAEEDEAENTESEQQGEQETTYVELLLLRAVQQQLQEEALSLSQFETKNGSSEETAEQWRQLEAEQAEVLRLLEDIVKRHQEQNPPQAPAGQEVI